MTHNGTWTAVDKIAEIMGITCSALAKRCGLDATAFNKSKRYTKYGQPRWLSGQTLSKIIDTAGITDAEFFRLANMAEMEPQSNDSEQK